MSSFVISPAENSGGEAAPDGGASTQETQDPPHQAYDEGGGGSFVEDMVYQRDVSMELARKLAQDLDAKKGLLSGRLENALRLSAEAEVRLGKANREYQVKHLTLRKRMLTVVATLALASFIGWLVSALITQKFSLGAVLILPLSLAMGIHLFGKLEGEDGLLQLARS
ncbi:Hypothetical protein NocV09_00401070 [Nannochloropsis oceanica]